MIGGRILSYPDEIVNQVYDKTNGYCEYCGKKIHFQNYGIPDATGSWEIDHLIPVSRGGSDGIQNLFPACTFCNRSKQDMTGSEFIRWLKDESHI